MEKFTEFVECPKCGNDLSHKGNSLGIQVEYFRTSFSRNAPDDYLSLTCNRCRYSWKMYCKDSDEENKNE